jgi:hypothetical protein
MAELGFYLSVVRKGWQSEQLREVFSSWKLARSNVGRLPALPIVRISGVRRE